MSGFVFAAAESGSGSSTLIVVGLIALGFWIASLVLHPYTACSACKGSPRSYGAVATRSFRMCSACGGNGRRLRFGAGLFRGE